MNEAAWLFWLPERTFSAELFSYKRFSNMGLSTLGEFYFGARMNPATGSGDG